MRPSALIDLIAKLLFLPFVIVGLLFELLVRFTDEHDGAVTALATVIVAVFTWRFGLPRSSRPL